MNLKLAVTMCLALASCDALEKTSDDPMHYQCPNPGDKNVEGKGDNFAHMTSGIKLTSGYTKPSGLLWKLKKESDDFYLQVRDTSYLLTFNDSDNSWSIKNAAREDQSFGKFVFFHRTVSSAVDSNHCGTGGYKFNVKHGDVVETDEFVYGIE